MKVKVDGMSEKPANTTESLDPNEVTELSLNDHDCAGGMAMERTDFVEMSEKCGHPISIQLDDMDDDDDEVLFSFYFILSRIILIYLFCRTCEPW